MKTTIALAITLALAGSSMHAEKLANGLEFRTPEGWTVKTNDQAAVLAPADMVMEPGGNEPAEIYLLGMQEAGIDVRDPQAVATMLKQYFPAESHMKLVGAPQPFHAAGGNGYLYRYDAVNQGVPLRLQIYLVGLTNGGAAGLVAVARPALMLRREAALATVAGSLSRSMGAAPSHPAPPVTTTAQAQRTAAPAPAANRPTGGPLAAQWDQRLRGRKLYQFSGYSSSYGSGGYNSQRTLLLGVNGIYEFRRSGSVSVYVPGASGGSASQSGDQGRWRIYEQGGKVMLELVSEHNGTETITLTADGSKTLLNGSRWLVGD